MRHERAAPVFDNTKPRELPRFFDDLELLMDRALVQSADKKKQVLRYVDFDTEQIWKTFPEYNDGTKTYDDFKTAIIDHYPDAAGDFVYSLRDIDLLVGERQRLGVNTSKDLSDYHLQFMAITSWLIDKEQLGKLEQQRAYVRGFQPQLLTSIMNRLQLKNPDHHPNIPHNVKDVYEAARFILQGTSPSSYGAPAQQIGARTDNTTTPSNVIKVENFAPFLAEFTKSIVAAIQSTNNPRMDSSSYNQRGPSNRCIMCGNAHLIQECAIVDDFIKEGKCKRNHEGKVVLPSGAYVPREITGRNLADRINEWHRRNPNQLAAATMIHTIERQIINPPTVLATIGSTANPTYILSANDRIATLEAELFNLRARKQPVAPAVRTRAQRAREPTPEEEEEEVAAARKQTEEPPVQQIEVPKAPEVQPEHPYRNAKDAAYVPPTNRNVGAQDKGAHNNFKKPDAAYKTLPPIHDPNIATAVYKRSMETPITITQRELLSLSPEVRSQVRESTTTRRIPNNSATAQNYLQADEEDFELTPESVPTFAVQNAHHRTPPTGSIVVPDPYETYYRSLKPGEEPDPDRLIVAMESGAVRSIFSLIDSSQKKECILDPGCQIVAMSESTCHDLALVYDPSIKLNMQSANGNIDQSLGLSRNVPFQIGPITFYLQVHVIKSPAYDVLLGRPFDILTESVVRNFANEDQTITIHDPNTGRRATVPTLPRGQKNRQSSPKEEQDF